MKTFVRLTGCILIISALLLSVTILYAVEPCGIMGDINGDSKIGLEEAIFALQIASGMNSQDKEESGSN